MARIDDALMAWSMRNERRKSRLFRFVDCLPMLRSPQTIARHLREYLHISVPGFSPLLAAAATFAVSRMARKFIAADDLDQAVKTIADLRGKRLAFTVDLLGEAVVSEMEADQFQRRYLELVESLPARLAGFAEDPLIDRDSDRALPRAMFP